jgi:hypothetical protein
MIVAVWNLLGSLRLWNSATSLCELIGVDFRPIKGFSTYINYDSKEFSSDAPHMMMAALLHFNCNMGTLVRYMGGPHVGAQRDAATILKTIKPSVNPTTRAQIKRFLTQGAPTLCQGHSTATNFRVFLCHGNHQSAVKNPDKLMNVFTKDVNRGYALCFDIRILQVILHLHLTPLLVSSILTILGKTTVLCLTACSIPTGIPLQSMTSRHPTTNHFWSSPTLSMTSSFGSGISAFPIHKSIYCWVTMTLRVPFGWSNTTPTSYQCTVTLSTTNTWALLPAKYLVTTPVPPVSSLSPSLGKNTPCGCGRIDPKKPLTALPITSKKRNPPPQRSHWKLALSLPKPTPIPRIRASSNLTVHAPPFPHHVDDNLFADVIRFMRLTSAASIIALIDVLGRNHPCQPDTLSAEKLKLLYEEQRQLLGHYLDTQTMTLKLSPRRRAKLIAYLRDESWMARTKTTLRELATSLVPIDTITMLHS